MNRNPLMCGLSCRDAELKPYSHVLIMNTLFYLASAVAIISTILAVTRLNAVHALLYAIVSLLSVAVIFFALGAPFVAALEVIVYAGAIMVLFIFVVMMLSIGRRERKQEQQWLSLRMWVGPVLLAGVLAAELFHVIAANGSRVSTSAVVGPKALGIRLFTHYVLGVELASILLLAAIVGVYHLGRRAAPNEAKGKPS